MAWAGGKIFRAFVADMGDNTTPFDLGTDVPKVALYTNAITPDNDVTAANSCYNVGQWATANEVWQAVQWPQGGVALSGTNWNSGTADLVFYDATDTSSGTAATLANVFGCLVYDDTIASPADQGLSYNYFGGTQTVTNGQMTVVWNTNGIFRFVL